MTISFTNKETKLLKVLIESNSFLSVDYLASQIGFSRRSIYTFIQKISDKCMKLNIEPPRNVYKQGYFLTGDAKNQLRDIIFQDNSKSDETFKLSVSERKTFDLLLLFLNDNVTTTIFMKWEGVSRSTVLNDLEQLRSNLKEYKIQILANQNGHYLHGSELGIRDYVQSTLREHSDLLNDFFSKADNSKKLSELLNLQSMLNDWIQIVESKTNRIYTENMVLFFEKYYSLILWRMMNDKILLQNDFITDTAERSEMENDDEYSLVRAFVIQFGKNLVDTDECFYLESLLLEGQRRTQDLQKQSAIKKDILNVTNEIIENFKQMSGVSFKNEKQLSQDLYVHLLATYYRVKYQHQYVDGSVEQIKKDYPDIYTYTKISIYPFEKLSKGKLKSNEISLIAIYFGAQIIRDKHNRKKALIVCSSGIGTSRFLMAQLNNVFPSIKLVGPMSEKEYKTLNHINADIVISTIPLMKRDKEVIKVNPIMNESDLNDLKKQLAINNIVTSKQSSNQIKSLLDVISDNAEIKNISGLIVGLKEVLTFAIDPKSKIERGYQPMLSELLKPNNINFLSAKNLNWEDAIELAAKPLLNNGDITKEYTDAMINSVKKNGPYINIGGKVALAHARPEAGVKKLSMSVLKLDQAIDLVDNDHKIQLIFVLAAIDSTSHLKALSELAGILGDKQKLNSLLQAKDEKDFLDIILRSEKNEISSGM